MSLPKNSAASGMVYGIVVGGDMTDPDPAQAGGLRVYFPTIHGKGVNPKHLAFSPRLVAPTRSGMQDFVGGLDPGSLVVALKDTGSNQCQIIGLANDLNNRDSTIAGNNDLLQNITKFFTQSTGVSQPPNIQKSSRGGAEIYKPVEKGDHFHDLLKGLPTHGALFPLAGTPIDAVSSIRTALQAAAAIPGLDVLSKLPGVASSLGSLLNDITSNPLLNKLISQALPRDVLNAVNSMSRLVQSVEQGESAGFMTSGRVNPEVYTKNAVDLLSQCTNVSDVTTALTRLQSDSSLFGMEAYGPVVVEQETPFGKVQMSYDTGGNQFTFSPQSVVAAAGALSKLMSGAGFPGAVPGENMFGQSAGTILNMMQRIPGGQGFSQALSMAQALNTSGAAQQVFNMAKKVYEGGSPLD
jgi:hypothetical protein